MVLIGPFIGYLIGSILPAYFVTKFLFGLDIRKLGNGNPGATNVKREVGFFPAVITASYDATKGLMAMAISLWILKFPIFWVYMSGVGAIAGHLFPFYLKFRGGRGVATATGMLIVSLFMIGIHIDFGILLGDLIYLIFFVMCIYFTSSDENFLALTVIPVLSMLVVIRAGFSDLSIFVMTLMIYIFVVSLLNLKKLKIFNPNENIRLWRIFIRPASMSFAALNFFMEKQAFFTLIGAVLIVFFLMDLMRLLSERVNSSLTKGLGRFKIYKAKEAKRFSSITLFLMGIFLIFVIFNRETAILSLSFLVFGDMAAKIIGISYGRRKIFKNPLSKTFEGFLGFLAAAVSVSYFSSIFGLYPLWISIVGAIVAAIVESLPLSVDDNLSVPLLSGAIMTFFKMI